MESRSPPPLKEQVPETPLLCLSVAAARSNLVVVTASVKGYQEPMTALIDSGASFNFATNASVVKNSALYASALEASKSNTNVSVRLVTGSIVSTRKVTIPLSVKFDDFNSIEPFIVLDMDDRYDLILGMPWLANMSHGTVGGNHVAHAHGAVDSQGADALTEMVALELVLAQTKVDESGLPPRKVLELGQLTEMAALELALAQKKEVESGLPSRKALELVPLTQWSSWGPHYARRDSWVSSLEGTRRARACAPKDETLRVLDVLSGKPKVGVTLAPLPSVTELLELEELSYLDFLESVKAEELEAIVLVRAEL
ncbi:unnamed protein product [Phytophthora fragariaefolia]|uniref:Unnamed protein product n=1 Tax=Phytophthora fragariaefolia TaxID=1490495 RepID=A0A9W7CZ66_9STRA|nr:unnamed protein product [Phytophthora fragariaefolia]